MEKIVSMIMHLINTNILKKRDMPNTMKIIMDMAVNTTMTTTMIMTMTMAIKILNPLA